MHASRSAAGGRGPGRREVTVRRLVVRLSVNSSRASSSSSNDLNIFQKQLIKKQVIDIAKKSIDSIANETTIILVTRKGPFGMSISRISS